MRYMCSHCKQTSVDGNLWCQDIECPAGSLPPLMHYGDYLGNIQVLRVMRVLRTAVIYEAQREAPKAPERLYLKIANVGDEKYLENEALSLAALQRANSPYLPRLVPHGAENAEPFGRIVFRGSLRTFYLMAFVPGDMLADYLLDNPEPWHKNIGYLMLGLARAVMTIHAAGKLHLNLNPENVLVWMNSANVPQPLLLDMGAGVPQGRLTPQQLRDLTPNFMTAYMPPELVRGQDVGVQADVYGLGVIMYEMLGGHPAFAYRLRRRKDIQDKIVNTKIPDLKRPDLPTFVLPQGKQESVANIAETAVQRDPGKRYQQVAEMHGELLAVYREIPEKRRRTALSGWQVATLVLGLVAVVLFVVVMFVIALTTDPTTAMIVF